MTVVRPSLLWPSKLLRPPEELKTVYLDMNHWINLAKAAKGLPSGARYCAALEACRAARTAGKTVFVLAAAHYQEMTKIESPRQRRDLAELMEELSGFTTLVNRLTVMRLEIEEMLDHRLGPAAYPVDERHLLGLGVGHACAEPVQFRLKNTNDGSDATEIGRALLGAEAFDNMMAAINLEVERELLRGPEDEEIPDLQQNYGYIADIAEQIAQRRADQENDQARRHAGTPWARGPKLTDVVLAREVLLELYDPLLAALQKRGHQGLRVLMPEREEARVLVQSMPSSAVSALLKAKQHRNPARPWTSNDVFDVDALSLAVPYCDIVVTEKNRWYDLRMAKVDEQMDTVVLRRLDDLVPLL
jgi:hypothetical protein